MMVNSINIFVYLHLEMIFLKIQDKNFVLCQIKYRIRQLNKKKKGMKRRLSEQKTKVIKQISFCEGILQRINECQGAVEYSFFTDENDIEFFYISMILDMRGHYQTLKSLCEIEFTEHEKLHAGYWWSRAVGLNPSSFS